MQETARKVAANRSLEMRDLLRGCLDVPFGEQFVAKQVAKSPGLRCHLKGTA